MLNYYFVKAWTPWVKGLLWRMEHHEPWLCKRVIINMNKISSIVILIWVEKCSFFILCFLWSLWSSLTEKKSKGFFHQMSKTHSTVIGVASGVVLLLLIISVFIQMKQPRKKVTINVKITM